MGFLFSANCGNLGSRLWQNSCCEKPQHCCSAPTASWGASCGNLCICVPQPCCIERCCQKDCTTVSNCCVSAVPVPRCSKRNLDCCVELPRHRGICEVNIRICNCQHQNCQLLLDYEVEIVYMTCCCEKQKICAQFTACCEDVPPCCGQLKVKPVGEPCLAEGRCHVAIRQVIEICC